MAFAAQHNTHLPEDNGRDRNYLTPLPHRRLCLPGVLIHARASFLIGFPLRET